MFVSEKEQKIRKAIQESTGIDIDIDQQANFDFIKNFRSYKIKKILLVSSSYNFFQLEEEGRLNTYFQNAGLMIQQMIVQKLFMLNQRNNV